jgi:hypothetical protein
MIIMQNIIQKTVNFVLILLSKKDKCIYITKVDGNKYNHIL